MNEKVLHLETVLGTDPERIKSQVEIPTYCSSAPFKFPFVCLHLYSAQMEVKGLFVGVCFPFCHVSPRNRTHIITLDGKCLHPLSHPSILYRQRIEPSGDGRNLEDPATVKSRARQGSQTPRFWIKPSCIAQREKEESPSSSFSSFFATSKPQRQHICVCNTDTVSVFASLCRAAPTEPHSSCSSPPPTPFSGSPRFDALQGRPDQSELRSHFRHEAGPIAVWLTEGRVTLRHPVPLRQRGKLSGYERLRARRPKVVLVVGNARARARRPIPGAKSAVLARRDPEKAAVQRERAGRVGRGRARRGARGCR